MQGSAWPLQIIFLFMCLISSKAQVPEMVQSSPFKVADNLRSATITDGSGLPRFPLIEINGERLLFQFDLIQDDREWLHYRLIPCDMMGNVVEVDPSEFIQGFYQGEINDVELAFNTTTDYAHFSLTFPNDMMKPIQSGRYWLLVYRDDDFQNEDNQVVAFPLFVSGGRMNVNARRLKSNDVSKIYSHQQIETFAFPDQTSFNDIPRDIRVMIYQNFDLTTTLPPIAPTFITPDQWTFQHLDIAGFPGGNEWRVMDTRQIVTPGFHIDHTLPNQDLPEIWVMQDEFNAKSHYGWSDMNGITQMSTNIPSSHALDADYLKTHFQLKARAFTEGSVFVEFQTALGIRERLRLTYNNETQSYEGYGYLKQGIYNYRYRWISGYSTDDELGYTEGNFFDTQNMYQVLLYQKDPLYQKDQILGAYLIQK